MVIARCGVRYKRRGRSPSACERLSERTACQRILRSNGPRSRLKGHYFIRMCWIISSTTTICISAHGLLKSCRGRLIASIVSTHGLNCARNTTNIGGLKIAEAAPFRNDPRYSFNTWLMRQYKRKRKPLGVANVVNLAATICGRSQISQRQLADYSVQPSV